MDVGQTEPAPLVLERQAFVIDAKEMEDRCLKVVDVDGILNGIHTELVGCAIAHSRFDSATSHPDCERIGMVVTSPSFSIV